MSLSNDPVISTAAGAGIGAVVGAIAGAFVGASGLGTIVGGAVGGYVGAPSDRKTRGAVGGGVGSLLTPIGAVAGGAIAGTKPGRRGNPGNTAALVNNLRY